MKISLLVPNRGRFFRGEFYSPQLNSFSHQFCMPGSDSLSQSQSSSFLLLANVLPSLQTFCISFSLMLLLSCLILHSVPGHFQSKTPFTLLRPAWSLEAKASPLRPSNRYTTFYCFVRGLNQLSWALQLDLPHCRFRENMHIPQLKHKATKKWVLHQGRWK